MIVHYAFAYASFFILGRSIIQMSPDLLTSPLLMDICFLEQKKKIAAHTSLNKQVHIYW